MNTAIPALNEGEIYAGAIIAPYGTGHHVILLDGDHNNDDWNVSMEWAKSIGGDLPDRVEQAILHKFLQNRFQKEWYWSNTPCSGNSHYAWYQYLYDGYQYYGDKSRKLRAIAVRRIAI